MKTTTVQPAAASEAAAPASDTTPTGTGLADNLAPTARNLASAAKALAKLASSGWTPRGGYPGSDVLWPVRCDLCGWEGMRFYSHLRRDRPVSRHPGCLPADQRPAAQG